MAPPPGLAPPGSTSYTSNTLNVGDGTWDSSRKTFLLPNLMGLNYETMRYNGMGNRFKDLPYYSGIIKAHGIFAAITFLGIVPAAILIARFHDRNRAMARRLHIWLQITTVLLTTVIFILGNIAVGPSRALTNPHHGIGLAIYVLVLFQFFGGWYVHSRGKGKLRYRPTIKSMIHQWLGRTIALLGIIQVALGLTLWGSPLPLFIVYALVLFVLVVLYFVLTYQQAGLSDIDGRSTVGSRSEVIEDRTDGKRHSRIGTIVGTTAAGAALATLLGRRNRSRSRTGSRVDVVGSQRPSQAYIASEKHSDYDDGRKTWRDRLLTAGAIGGGLALAKSFFGRKERVDDDASYSYYSTTEGSPSRVDTAGRSGISRPPPTRPPNALPRRSESLSSVSSRSSVRTGRRGTGTNLRDGIATLGLLGFARSQFKDRRDRKEQRRLEDIRRREIEEERLARRGGRDPRYTGDNFPRRGGRRGSLTEDGVSTHLSAADTRSRHHHGTPGPVTDAAAGLAAGALAEEGLAGRGGSVPNVSHNLTGPVAMPEPPPDPAGIFHADSGSEEYYSSGGRPHRRHHAVRDAALASAAAGALATDAGGIHPLRSGESINSRPVSSTPVSVKVKMHNDGRKVTLRRLSEQEAAAERDARRRDGDGRRRRRHRNEGSRSDLGSVEGGNRWRRTEDLERQQAEQMAAEQRAAAGGAGLPPPPPTGGGAGPGSGGGGSIGSPGTYEGTEASGDYAASNRRRRRAERAAAQNQRAGGRDTVDYD